MKNPKTGRLIEVSVLTVTDLHQSAALFAELRRVAEQHRPDIVAVVGDCLHAGEDMKGRLTVAECAEQISSLPVKHVVFARGNHEDANWLEFEHHWLKQTRPLHALNGEVFKYGPLCLVGFPCYMGDETTFLGTKEPLQGWVEWLKPLFRLHGRAMHTLWLMHEPPCGTPLSTAHSVVAGNPAWNEAIDFFTPRLTISGHDHIAPIRGKCWHHRLGPTSCINVGQTNHGPLHYALVQVGFSLPTSPLPETIRVTAYPMAETIQC